MKYSDTLRRSGRNLRQSKARTLLTAAALAVGGFTLGLTLAAANGIRDYTHQLIGNNFDPSSLVVVRDKSVLTGGEVSSQPQKYSSKLTSVQGFLIKELSPSDVAKIKAVPGVDGVVDSSEVQVQYITRPVTGNPQYTAAVSAKDPHISRSLSAGSSSVQSLTPGQVLLPNVYLKLLDFSSAKAALGQKIVIHTQRVTGQTKAYNFVVGGVLAPNSPLTKSSSNDIELAGQDVDTINQFLTSGTINAGQVELLTVHVAGGNDVTKLNKTKQAIQKLGYGAESAKDAEQFINHIIAVLQAIILVFGAITLIASFFGVVNTQYISVLERTREIGLMKALGMSRRSVSRLFVIEATWIGFLGGLIGAALADVVGTALNPWISRKLSFGSQHLLVFKPLQIAILIVFLMLITTVAGLLPARKAAKLDPIEALRTE